jgi:hypothetical protein
VGRGGDALDGLFGQSLALLDDALGEARHSQRGAIDCGDLRKSSTRGYRGQRLCRSMCSFAGVGRYLVMVASVDEQLRSRMPYLGPDAHKAG